MALGMTAEQERDFEEKGFIVLEHFLTQSELATLAAAADEVVERIQKQRGLGPQTHFQVRNALAHHQAFVDENVQRFARGDARDAK